MMFKNRKTTPEHLQVYSLVKQNQILLLSVLEGQDSSYKEPEMASAHECTHLISMNSISIIIEQFGLWLMIHCKCASYPKRTLLRAVSVHCSLSSQSRQLLSFSIETLQFVPSTIPGSFSLVICYGNYDFVPNWSFHHPFCPRPSIAEVKGNLQAR